MDNSTISPGLPDDIAELLRLEQAKIPKLEVMFGPWWRHYTPASEFQQTLFAERVQCPYCGGPLGPLYVSAADAPTPFRGRAHQDHMDPLAKGGEDSIRNAVYVCDLCNYKKGNRLFVEWLLIMEPCQRASASAIYTEKHGHPPQDFVPNSKTARMDYSLAPLAFDLEVVRKLFPRPIVSGPPTRGK